MYMTEYFIKKHSKLNTICLTLPNAHLIRDVRNILRKEVIQPHLPIRLPCYDFTPIINPTFDGCLHKGWPTGFRCYRLSWCDGRCVQDPGTYSP